MVIHRVRTHLARLGPYSTPRRQMPKPIPQGDWWLIQFGGEVRTDLPIAMPFSRPCSVQFYAPKKIARPVDGHDVAFLESGYTTAAAALTLSGRTEARGSNRMQQPETLWTNPKAKPALPQVTR